MIYLKPSSNIRIRKIAALVAVRAVVALVVVIGGGGSDGFV